MPTPAAPSGLWTGLLFGILLGLFTSGHSFLAAAAAGAALGAAWGAVSRWDSPIRAGQLRAAEDFPGDRGDLPGAEDDVAEVLG